MARRDVQILHPPELIAKVSDVVGLYLAPPENAVVLCVEEKARSRPNCVRCPASCSIISTFDR